MLDVIVYDVGVTMVRTSGDNLPEIPDTIARIRDCLSELAVDKLEASTSSAVVLADDCSQCSAFVLHCCTCNNNAVYCDSRKIYPAGSRRLHLRSVQLMGSEFQ